VSRHHARLLVADSRVVLEDLGSKNGTLLRGERVSAPATLQAGDEIRIGPFTLTYRVAHGQATTETEA